MLTEVGGILFVPNLPEDQWDPLYKHYASCRDAAELCASTVTSWRAWRRFRFWRASATHS